jgi:aldehyde dehydrogenase (NAD+)
MSLKLWWQCKEGWLITNIAEIQRKYFKNGTTRDIKFRLSQLENLKQAIIKSEDKIYDALNKDLGKCSLEGFTTEVGLVLNEIDYMKKNISKFSKRQRVKTPAIFIGGSSCIIPEPYGTVLIIGPWNYPFQLVMMPLAGAIAAGNCAVVKPSELSPNVSSIITQLINSTFAKDYVVCVEGGVDASKVLLSQKFDYIFYTGSTTVGKVIMEAAAANLTPVTLELGGKSPCIVDENVSIKSAARRIAWGKFMNSGQTCVAPDYILVHKKVKKELVENIIAAINEFYGPNPIDSKDYARIINEKHFARLTSLMDDGNILYGGKSNRKKLSICPTLMDSVSETGKIMQDEIFGPLLPIMEFESIGEAVGFINSRPKPLALYVFSKDKTNIKEVLRNTSSGGVCVNDTINHIITHGLPFGGVGESGMGRYHGKASFDTFSHMKSVLFNQTLYDMKLKYPPYTVSIGFMKRVFKFLF